MAGGGSISPGEGLTHRTWVFDVDACLFDSLSGKSWRPGATLLLEHLRSVSCRLVLWSAGGREYAQRRATGCGVLDLFDDFHEKAERGSDNRYLVDFLEDLSLVMFIDDRPEDLPQAANVIPVRPYLVDNPHDRGLQVCGDQCGIDLFPR